MALIDGAVAVSAVEKLVLRVEGLREELRSGDRVTLGGREWEVVDVLADPVTRERLYMLMPEEEID